MYFFGIALIGILGGLAIALLTNWFPAYWNKQESEWKAELLSETQEATQHSVEKHSDFNLKKLLGEVFLVENRSNLILCLIIGITLSLPNFVLHGWTDLALLQFSLSCVLATSALIDLRTHILPDMLIYPALWFGLFVQTISTTETIGVVFAIWGAIIGYLVLWVPSTIFSLVRRAEPMGNGDFKLMALIGAWLGPQSIVPIAFAASSFAALFYLSKGWSRDQEFAFGPWLAGSAVLYMNAGLFRAISF